LWTFSSQRFVRIHQHRTYYASTKRFSLSDQSLIDMTLSLQRIRNLLNEFLEFLIDLLPEPVKPLVEAVARCRAGSLHLPRPIGN
jgi:hypothetical protein